jgi:hypothetical protein
VSFDPPSILSLGAGVQSTALALMALDGHLPPVDCVIFADTGWEPAGVYEHLDRLTVELEKHGVEVHIVSNGNIRADALAEGHRFASMPLHMKGEKGNGIGRRQCTSEYKLTPIKRKVRELLGAKVDGTLANGAPRVGRVPGRPGARFVEMWVGISTDEIERQKPADVSYIHRVDPLIDILNMDRHACMAYLEERWPWPVERSACIGCPYHTNVEWRRLRDEAPAEFADAVEFDVELRAKPLGGFKSEAYLHSDRVPLDEANLDKVTRRENLQRQGRLFEGCSPFGCPRSEISSPDSGGQP